MNDMALAATFEALSHDEAVDVLSNALAQSPEFVEIVKEYSEDEEWAMGQVPAAQEAMTTSVMRLLEPLMPALGDKLKEVAGPATERAMAVAIPKLKEQIPLFAAITGIVAGVLVVAGMYFAKKL
jgi:hypothetical protein